MQNPPEDSTYPEKDETRRTIEQCRDLDQHFTELYKKIRDLAARVRWNGTNPTLTPTALAHEAYLKLRVSPADFSAKSYDEIMAIFANAMLQILRDAARRKGAKKREFQELPGPPDLPVEEALIVAEALDSLHQKEPLQARVAQCRFLFGMTVAETAVALNISSRKVERLWQDAKGQLMRQFKGEAVATP